MVSVHCTGAHEPRACSIGYVKEGARDVAVLVHSIICACAFFNARTALQKRKFAFRVALSAPRVKCCPVLADVTNATLLYAMRLCMQRKCYSFNSKHKGVKGNELWMYCLISLHNN